jgi:hypothetical protein
LLDKTFVILALKNKNGIRLSLSAGAPWVLLFAVADRLEVVKLCIEMAEATRRRERSVRQ